MSNYKPKERERYWFISNEADDGGLVIGEDYWHGWCVDYYCLKQHNVFHTKREAQAMLKQVLKLLKG